MDENVISKFIDLISKEASYSEAELINIGKSLGMDLFSTAPIKDSTNDAFVDKIREKSLEVMERSMDNCLPQSDLFYVGSIDFMVCEEPEGKKFFLLETNGGSNRGLSSITEKQQEIIYDGYYEAIDQAIKTDKRGDNKILILVGIPINDGLFHEKIMMLNYFRQKLQSRNLRVEIFDIKNFTPAFEGDIAFLIADYKQLSTTLSFSDNWVKINDQKISILIGDGIARRLDNKEFARLIKEDFRKIHTIIINPVFRITDDKSLTYLASYYAKDILEKYNLKYLIFTKAYNENELIDKIHQVITKFKRPFIIKPDGGSGGAGVIPISPEEDHSNIKNLIEESKKEFFGKFMKNRNPFPYTIQEMADFSLITPPWDKNGKHTFDLRIYMAQKGGIVVPIGGLARIARESYSGSLDKQEFVVNLSGYDGFIDIKRGRGISEEICELLNLNFEDYVNMFCIGCVMFASMAKNYQKIINFSNWNQMIE
ncbi:MAG: hypothetical protein EU532_00095 [Promethearchaeota archaeon]|nr:MAG: hypothetical protein EU532_00095 [Candidatus Lokiarchaeota archaeon]